MKTNIIPVFLNQRGCPFKCIYCHQATLWNDFLEVTPRTTEEFLDKALTKNNHSDAPIEVAFYGGTFTGLPLEQQNAYLKLAYQAKQANRIQAIRLSTRPDLLPKEVIGLLKTYEVDMVELGVQSLDDEVLRLSRRGYTAKKVRGAVHTLRQAGIRVSIQLMCGLPGDSYQRHCQTLEKVISLKPDAVRLYPTLVLAATPLAELYREGKYQPLDLETAVEWGVVAFEKLTAHAIPLIRLGLHLSLSDEMAAKLVAGPVHPAYGQLVKSRCLRKKVEQALQKLPRKESSEVEFAVPSRWLSDFLGVKRQEFNYLVKHYPQFNFSLSGSASPNTITISSAKNIQRLQVAS